MTVQFLQPEFSTLDVNKNDTFVFCFFSNEKPLKGIKGLLDWRMNGRISRLIIEGKITGILGESIIMPTNQRISANKVCMFGLGDSKEFSMEKCRKIILKIIDTLKKLNVHSFSLPLPGSPIVNLLFRERTQILMEEVFKSYEISDLKKINLGIIEGQHVQRQISDVVHSFIRTLSPSNIRIL